MEILITSKTHKGKAACVGGIVLNSNRFVRLLNKGNWDQYTDTIFKIGDIWDIEFKVRDSLEPPHIEDVIITNSRYVRHETNISDYLLKCGIEIYTGSPNQIFHRRLGWTKNGSGYIDNKENLPENSVGFWISDEDLILDDDKKHYIYPQHNIFMVPKRFPYVGFEDTVPIIPKGTLMRISLARWWKPEDSDADERCYLQLSGWYGL